MPDPTTPPPGRPFLERVRLRNYKSIGKCEVELRPLTVLVGRNGAGKSNFIDALHFVVDSIQTSLDHAINIRGGIDLVRRISTGHPRNFAIELDLWLPEYRLARYGFEIAAEKDKSFAVKREKLSITLKDNRPGPSFLRQGKKIEQITVDNPPPVLGDRLFLVNAAGLPEFRPVYDAVLAMGFYNLNPDAMKELQSPDAGELLHGDASNIASVIARLSQERPQTIDRIKDYLKTIVPDIEDLSRVALGPKETVQFKQQVKGASAPWKFYSASMSDGTLRALGALVAVAQLPENGSQVKLVAIEEPESALHPAAAGALMEALREGAGHTQVLLTTHSPELLDQIRPEEDGLLVVQSEGGTSSIALADPASRRALQEHLFTAGELLRLDQLQPDPADLDRQAQLRLFRQPA